MDIEIISCPNGHPNASGQRFCGDCGTELRPTCPSGHVIVPGQHFCPECGQATSVRPDVRTPTAPQQDQTENFSPSQDFNTGELLPQPSEGIPTSPAGWFNRQSPLVQWFASAALLIPTLVIALFAGRLRGGPAELVIVVVLMIGFLAALGVAARTQRRRLRALAVGAVTTLIAVATYSLMLYWPRPEEIASFIWVPLFASTIGFVAAWSIARRAKNGMISGIAVSVLPAVGLQIWLGSQVPGWMMLWALPVAAGCFLCWCVELAANSFSSDSYK